MKRFLDQSHNCTILQGLLSVGVASSNSALPGKDHFDLVENLTDIESQLTQSVLQFITAHTLPCPP